MTFDDHWWGRHPPKDAPLAWGARAIQEGGSFSLLPDRQSMRKTDDERLREEWVDVLNTQVLPTLRVQPYAASSTKVYEGQLDTPLGTVAWEASTNASYGYVYVAAWLLALPPEGWVVFRARSNKNDGETPPWLEFLWGVNALADVRGEPHAFETPSKLDDNTEEYPEATITHFFFGEYSEKYGKPHYAVAFTPKTERMRKLFEVMRKGEK